MALAFLTPSVEVEQSVHQELLDWSSKVLAKASPHFNGLPPCPYAQQAWISNSVSVLFKYENNKQGLYSTISRFDDLFDLAIIVDFKFDEDPKVFHDYLDQMNDVISEGMFIDRDMWVMGFHPHDEESEFVQDVDFKPRLETEYAMIFVQRLSKLQEAADKLDKKGYYNVYDGQYNAREIYEKRERFHRSLKNGYKT
tara:strand:- start:239 stop:829 length:591 start_codon:yes stop_codon:yes gene_type:complete